MSKPRNSQEAKRARVLLACDIGGKRYKPNDIIEAAASVIAAAEKEGKADSHPAAIKAAEEA